MSIRPFKYRVFEADEGECGDGINAVGYNKIIDSVNWLCAKGADCGGGSAQTTQVSIPYSGAAKVIPSLGQINKNIPITQFNLTSVHAFPVYGNCTHYMVEAYLRIGANGSRFRGVPKTGSVSFSLYTSVPDGNYLVEKIGHYFYSLQAYTVAYGAPAAPATELAKIQINPDKPPVRGHLQRVSIIGEIPAALRPSPYQCRWAFLKVDYLHPGMTGTYYFDQDFHADDADGIVNGQPVNATTYTFDGVMSYNVILFKP